jgi:hypothetical protein
MTPVEKVAATLSTGIMEIGRQAPTNPAKTIQFAVRKGKASYF